MSLKHKLCQLYIVVSYYKFHCWQRTKQGHTSPNHITDYKFNTHLRIWGYLAYIHVQKDKRTSFESHMEKCIFVGYSAGYKGWQFYNPASRRFIILEKAEFDERYFPGIKTSLMDSILLSTIFNPVNSGNMPDLGERWCC